MNAGSVGHDDAHVLGKRETLDITKQKISRDEITGNVVIKK